MAKHLAKGDLVEIWHGTYLRRVFDELRAGIFLVPKMIVFKTKNSYATDENSESALFLFSYLILLMVI